MPAALRGNALGLLVGALAILAIHGSALAAGWTVTPLYAFDSLAPAKGDDPRGNLAAGADGSFYGATESGGANSLGAIFQLKKDTKGVWKEIVLFSFVAAKGSLPQSGVVLGKDNALYGTTTRGGARGGGTVYRLAKVGSAWAFTVLHHFNLPGGEGTGNRGALALDTAGNIYGTTTNSDGSFPGEGIVYQLKRPASGPWTFKILHAFAGGNGGKDPEGGVVIGPKGELYGVSGGSSTTPGTLYRITPNAAKTVWTHQVLHRFVATVDGRYPNGTLARDGAGTLYGVCFSGGLMTNFQYGGTVFSYVPGGAFQTIYRFLAKPDDGYAPMAGPIVRGGVLFGTTSRGGVNDEGTVFRLSRPGGGAWTQTLLHGFDGPTEGAGLRGPLLFAGGKYYGMAESQGPAGGGTVFSIGP